MTQLVGIVLAAGALALFIFSLPRHGKTARFVGSRWEGYIVVAMLCVFGLGLTMLIDGAVKLIQGVS